MPPVVDDLRAAAEHDDAMDNALLAVECTVDALGYLRTAVGHDRPLSDGERNIVLAAADGLRRAAERWQAVHA